MMRPADPTMSAAVTGSSEAVHVIIIFLKHQRPARPNWAHCPCVWLSFDSS